jgi:hypothetical protein
LDRVSQMKLVQTEAMELFKRKNTDYGDAFAKFGPVGVLVRLEDKIQRYITMVSQWLTTKACEIHL